MNARDKEDVKKISQKRYLHFALLSLPVPLSRPFVFPGPENKVVFSLREVGGWVEYIIDTLPFRVSKKRTSLEL